MGETVRDFLPPGGTIRLDRMPGSGAGDDEGNEEEWGFAADDAPPSVEATALAEAREAAAYGELLETLKELVDAEAAGPPPSGARPSAAHAPAAAGGPPKHDDAATSEATSTAASEADGGASEADLLAAGRMSGVEDAPDEALMEMAGAAEAGAAQSAASLQGLLIASLGQATFDRAHSRLQNVVEEEDDDVLVQDIQTILGPERLDQLPRILQLIFLEGGGGAA